MKKADRFAGAVSGSVVMFLLTAFPSPAGCQNNPAPLVNQPVVPTTAAPGGPGFTLTVNGTGFVSGSTVKWNGVVLATQFVSASQLTATVPASDVALPGTAALTVSSPAPGGGVSNPELFSVTSPRASIALGAPGTEAAGAHPSSVAVGDFNGDGKPDLAVVNMDGSTVSVLLGNGNGTFQPPMTFATGNFPYFVAPADLNHDGKMDLAVTNTGDDTVSVLLGNGDGTFQPHVDYPVGGVGATQSSLAFGDFNRDGNVDMAVANYWDQTVSILLGNGDGTFQPQLTFVAGGGSVAVGDFNSDGILDLDTSGGTIFLGNGDGTFTYQLFLNLGSTDITADFNGDGKLDLASATPVGDSSSLVYVALGNGDGTFQTSTTYAMPPALTSLAAADLNGDGKLDLVVGTENNEVSTLLGNGDGTFQGQIGFASGLIESVAAGDFNGDGLIDVATIDGASSAVFLGTTAELSSYILNFGTVSVGVTSPSQTVTLTNGGGAALAVSSIVASAPFALSNNCGSSLAAGASCVINVNFTPTSVGNQAGVLTVTDSAAGGAQNVGLSGVGGGPVAVLSGHSLVFTDQKVGTLSGAQRVTLTNTGNLALTISSLTVTGDFLESNTCGTSLAASASCTISVIFKPEVKGVGTGTVTITDNAAGSPQTVSLTGTGIVFELSPPSLNFGSVQVGQTPSQNVTLTNSSKSVQTVGGIRLSGNHLGEFSQTNTCGASVGAGDTCTITVTFAPTKTGNSNATLEVSGGGANQTVSASGTGTQ